MAAALSVDDPSAGKRKAAGPVKHAENPAVRAEPPGSCRRCAIRQCVLWFFLAVPPRASPADRHRHRNAPRGDSRDPRTAKSTSASVQLRPAFGRHPLPAPPTALRQGKQGGRIQADIADATAMPHQIGFHLTVGAGTTLLERGNRSAFGGNIGSQRHHAAVKKEAADVHAGDRVVAQIHIQYAHAAVVRIDMPSTPGQALRARARWPIRLLGPDFVIGIPKAPSRLESLHNPTPARSQGIPLRRS